MNGYDMIVKRRKKRVGFSIDSDSMIMCVKESVLVKIVFYLI
jgi:hypothetical protein